MSTAPSPTISIRAGVTPSAWAACRSSSGDGLRCSGMSAPCTASKNRRRPASCRTARASAVGLLVTTTSGRLCASSATVAWMPSKTALPAIGARKVAASKPRRSRAASSYVLRAASPGAARARAISASGPSPIQPRTVSSAKPAKPASASAAFSACATPPALSISVPSRSKAIASKRFIAVLPRRRRAAPRSRGDDCRR